MQYYDVGQVGVWIWCELLKVSLMWGELSCVQAFRPKSVSPEFFLDQEQFACIISLIFLIFLKHNPPTNFF